VVVCRLLARVPCPAPNRLAAWQPKGSTTRKTRDGHPRLSFAEASPGLSLAVCRKRNIQSVSAFTRTDRDIGASDDAKRP
jgi:hypothetical protein